MVLAEPESAVSVQLVPSDDDDEIVDSEEVARMLHVSERYVRSLARRGVLPHAKLESESGKRVRYRFTRGAVRAYVRGERPAQ